MSGIQQMLLGAAPLGGGAVDMGDIGHSLRFRGLANQLLTRSWLAATARNIWTFSAWVKLDPGKAGQAFIGSNFDSLQYNYTAGTGKFTIFRAGTGTLWTSVPLVRDGSAWGHFLAHHTGTQINFYWNGVSIGSHAIVTTDINGTVGHAIGDRLISAGASKLNGYMARICFVDGLALPPSDFAETNSEGTWISKSQAACKAIVDGPGNNNFMLDFDTGAVLANLGNDFSDNNNDWTVGSAISITLGADYDWMKDTPSNNHATLNPLLVGTSTLSKAMLTSAGAVLAPTILPASGTWYLERSNAPLTWTPPAAFPAAAGDYNFGQRPFTGAPSAPLLNAEDYPADAITMSGSFTGNANANGPFVWLGGVPETMTINGNAVTWGTHADKTAGGFKVRTNAAGYNAAGNNTFTVTVAGALFKYANAQVNP